MVGIISTLVSLVIGIAFGATAGYMGGKVDEVMIGPEEGQHRPALLRPLLGAKSDQLQGLIPGLVGTGLNFDESP